MPPVMLVANALLFQAGWLAAVLGAARGLPWLGLAAAAVAVAWHLARAPRALPELGLLALALAVGAVFETALVQAGLLRFETESLVAGSAPLWMMALWAVFATTLNVSLRLLRGRPVVAALFGAVGAPLAYYAGGRLGALEFVDMHAALAAVGAGWLVLTPALVAAAARLDGYAPL
jgi:hypothetical protein